MTITGETRVLPEELPLLTGGCRKFFDHLPGVSASRIILSKQAVHHKAVPAIERDRPFILGIDLQVVGRYRHDPSESVLNERAAPKRIPSADGHS